MKVLLCEDNRIGREALAEAISLVGWYVMAVRSGEACVLRAKRASPADVLVVDHYMNGGISGLEALLQIRGLPPWEKTPAVLLTAAADADIPGLERKLAELAPCRLVRKPCDFDRLRKIMMEMAGGGA